MRRNKRLLAAIIATSALVAPAATAQIAPDQDMAAQVARQQALIDAQGEQLQRQAEALDALRAQVARLAERDVPLQAPSAPLPAGSPVPSAEAPRIKLGGFIQTDLLYFPDASPGEAEDLLHPSILSVDAAVPGRGRFRATARDTRFNVDIRRDSSIGLLRAFAEIDFHGSVIRNAQSQFNAYEPRLRHAYAEWTSTDERFSVLAGQNWSAFADPATYASTYNSLVLGSVFIRQPQLRLSYRTGGGVTLSASIENPQGDIGARGRSDHSEQFDGLPDFVLTARLDRKWGSLQLGGLLRRIDEPELGESITGWGVSGSGVIHVPLGGRKQKLRFQAVYGTGIGRYIGELGPGFDGYMVDGRGLEHDRVVAGNISYEHHFADWLSGTVKGSHTEVKAPEGVPGDRVQQISAFIANIVVHPVSQIDLAFEYAAARRQNEEGSEGSGTLLRFTTRYRF